MANPTSDQILKRLHDYECSISYDLMSQAKDYLRERSKMMAMFKEFCDRRELLSEAYAEKSIQEKDKHWYAIYASKDLTKKGEPRKNAKVYAAYSSEERAIYALQSLAGGGNTADILPQNPIIVKIKATNEVQTDYFNFDFTFKEDDDMVQFCEYILEHGQFTGN